MKAFPFICSRTKNQDFRIDYLVRPDDIEWQLTKSYISDAMYDLNSLNDFRYAVFSVGDYCILGIGCLSRYLVSQLNYEIDKDFLRDKVGRSLACFIGFAIPLNKNGNLSVPNMSGDEFLKKCCEVYFKHLSKQWLNSNVVSEKIDADGKSSFDGTDCLIDLPEIASNSLSTEFEDTYKNIKVSRVFNSDDISYFLNQILNYGNHADSFITHIDYEDQWQRVQYKYIIISNALYSNLPRIQTRDEENANKEVLRKIEELKVKQHSLLKNYEENLSEKVKELEGYTIELDTSLKELEKAIDSLNVESSNQIFEDIKCLFYAIAAITEFNYNEAVTNAECLEQNIMSVSSGNTSAEVVASCSPLLQLCRNIHENSNKIKFDTSSYKEKVDDLKNDYKLAIELKSIQNDVDKIVISESNSIDFLKKANASCSSIKSGINEFKRKSNNTIFNSKADDLLNTIEKKEEKVSVIITQKKRQIEQVQAKKEIPQKLQISNDDDLIEALKSFTELNKIIKGFIGDPIKYLISYLNSKRYSPDYSSGLFSKRVKSRVYTIDQGDVIINLLISCYYYQFLNEGINVGNKKNLELEIPEQIFKKYYR